MRVVEELAGTRVRTLLHTYLALSLRLPAGTPCFSWRRRGKMRSTRSVMSLRKKGGGRFSRIQFVELNPAMCRAMSEAVEGEAVEEEPADVVVSIEIVEEAEEEEEGTKSSWTERKHVGVMHEREDLSTTGWSRVRLLERARVRQPSSVCRTWMQGMDIDSLADGKNVGRAAASHPRPPWCTDRI